MCGWPFYFSVIPTYVVQGFSQSRVSEMFWIGNLTISDIKKSETKLQEFCTTTDELSVFMKGQKVMRKVNNSALDEALYLRFVQQRLLGAPISGPILCEEVLHLFRKIHALEDTASTKEFKASKGWLGGFATGMV